MTISSSFHLRLTPAAVAAITAAAALCTLQARAADAATATDTAQTTAQAAAATPVPRGKPLWELGVGAAVMRLPDYSGSDVSHNYLLPLPWFIYRGKWLRADRQGARAVLVDNENWSLNLSAHASAPVRSNDNPARLGMTNLPATVELGPKVRAHLWHSADDAMRLDFNLPVRAVITLQRRPDVIGAVVTPTLNLDLPRFQGGWNLGFVTGPNWGSRDYHQHLYGVSAAEATSARPAYAARAGYAGWQTLAALSRRFDDAWVGMYLRYERLDGSVFLDSPLVRQRGVVSGGVAVAWVLARSGESARSDD